MQTPLTLSTDRMQSVQAWRKLGKVFCATGETPLMVTGGRAPVALPLGDDVYRIYFASYDDSGRGRVFFLELNINAPERLLHLETNAILDIGATGFFDDNGIIPSFVLRAEDEVRLYTIGFSVKNKLIFDAATGLAISRDGGLKFDKINGPVLDRGVDDPCFAASPCVLFDNHHWRMWYVSCDRWEKAGAGYKHYYNIKHKVSDDGIYWEPKSTICIDYANEYEYAISRPSVIKRACGDYLMWYSFRAQEIIGTYRIGFATSSDGLAWKRADHLAGIDVSEEGWDSEMICYPYVFEHGGRYFMLYNGNGYGRTGFGLAVLDNQ